MKKLLTVIIIALSIGSYAQWGAIQKSIEKKTESHFRHKGEKIGEKHAEEGIKKGEDAAIEGVDKLTNWSDEQLADEETFIDTNLIEYNDIIWPLLSFTPGENVIFYDRPFSYEKEGKEPQNFYLKEKSRGKIQVLDMDMDKALLASADGYLIPKVKNPEKDYLPDDFTIEFDFNITVSPFSKPMYLYLFDKIHQSGKNLKPIIINRNKVSYKDSSGYYPVVATDENGMSTWYHFSLSYNNGIMKVYLNERLMFKIKDDINPTGLTVEYMAYTPIMFKNFLITSNLKTIKEQINSGKLISYNIDYNPSSQKLDGISVSILSKIAKVLKEDKNTKLDIEVYFSKYPKEKNNKKYGLEKAGAIDKVLTAMGVDKSQINVFYKGSYIAKANDTNNKTAESVIFIKK